MKTSETVHTAEPQSRDMDQQLVIMKVPAQSYEVLSLPLQGDPNYGLMEYPGILLHSVNV